MQDMHLQDTRVITNVCACIKRLGYETNMQSHWVGKRLREMCVRV